MVSPKRKEQEILDREQSLIDLDSPSFAAGSRMQAKFSKKVSLKIKEQPTTASGELISASAPLLTATSKLLFVLLPFIVIAMTLGYKGQIGNLFALPEWSIVSAVIAGQSFVTLMSASNGRMFANREMSVLLVSALLVVVLMPVLVLMSIVMSSPTVSTFLATCQCVFFVLSLAIFFFGSLVGNPEVVERS